MITLTLDRDSETPLYQQLYLTLRRMITAGTLKKGEKLPSKRALAARLEISVITVERAYGQLLDEGFLSSRAGSGFYVEELQIPRDAQREDPAPAAKKREEHANKILYSYTTSGTDTASFPFSIWQKLSREVLSGSAEKLLSPCPSAGTEELRAAIAGYLRDFRGMTVLPEQIVVGAGSEYLVGLAIKLLGREKLYGIENPGYPKISKIFKENGAQVCPLPLDAQGLTLKGLRKIPDVLHLTPAHHFPTGITMPAGRRGELLWAVSKNGGYILEDDYDSEFRYRGQIPPTLFELDGGRRVICVGTFAKLLAPSLRISYMVLPQELCRLYDERLSFYACTVPVFEQLTLALFIGRGYLERHVNRMKKIYKKRRDAVCAAFGAFDGVSVSGEDAGLHLLAEFSDCRLSEEELVRRAEKAGVYLAGLRSYFIYGTPEELLPARPSLVLGFTGITEDEIFKSAEALKKVWNE